MGHREFDVVIFGASGFTGARVLRYISSACAPVRCGWSMARNTRSTIGGKCGSTSVTLLGLRPRQLSDCVSATVS